MLLALVKLETEDRGLDNIEHGRERASLTETMGGLASQPFTNGEIHEDLI